MIRNFFIAALAVFTLIACSEAELIIPGEQVGGGNNGGGEIPDPSGTVLKTYSFVVPDAITNEFNFNASGQMTSTYGYVNFLGVEQEVTGTLTYENNLLTTLQSAGGLTHSDNYTFSYNGDNQLVEINAGTTPETKLVITHSGSDMTAVRTVNGVQDATATFTKNAAGTITGYTITQTATSNTYSLSHTYTGGNITLAQLSYNGAVTDTGTYTYDDKINPVYLQSTDTYNESLVQEVFDTEFESGYIDIDLDFEGLYGSQNNMTQLVLSGDNVSGTLSYTYEYTENNYPTSAAFTSTEGGSGTVTYTYYE